MSLFDVLPGQNVQSLRKLMEIKEQKHKLFQVRKQNRHIVFKYINTYKYRSEIAFARQPILIENGERSCFNKTGQFVITSNWKAA